MTVQIPRGHSPEVVKNYFLIVSQRNRLSAAIDLKGPDVYVQPVYIGEMHMVVPLATLLLFFISNEGTGSTV